VVAGGIAKMARRDDVSGIVAIGMAFRQQVIPRERQPGIKGLRTIDTAVATFVVIALKDLGGVSAQGVRVFYWLP
jgi:hypothetical protein